MKRPLTDRFERTWIVNLPEREDRLREILLQLKRAGISLQPGRVEVFPAIKPEAPLKFPNIGARGCFMSHLSILERCLREKLHSVLILEDDVVFADLLVDGANEMLDSLEQMDWGIAYLGHSLKMPPAAPPGFVETAEATIGSHFYAVRGDAIAQLVDYLRAVLGREEGDPLGGPMHYDGALNMFRWAHPEIRSVAATQPLGFQGSSRSDVTPQPWDRLPVLRGLAQFVRSARRHIT